MTTADAAPGTKGERTRQRLLDHAVARFAADGFRATSVSAIARDAGITPAAVYAYFESKEVLFAAAVDADAGALIEKSRAEASDGGVRERWPDLMAALVAGLDEHPLARRVLAGREPEVIGRLLELPSLRQLRSEVASELRDAMAAGEVRRDLDPDAVALGLETVVLALLLGEVQTGAGDDPGRTAAVLAVIDAALRPA